MSKTIDGIIKEWGERLNYGRVHGRKTRNITGGRINKPSPYKTTTSARGRLQATIRKAPEVMVKITGGGKDMARIKAHIQYISRNGEVELENEQGDVYQGSKDLKDIYSNWKNDGYRIVDENGRRREAFNFVLSMPPNTNRDAVTMAVRDFAKEQFSDHQYLMVTHKDEDHPHVHLTVKAVSHNGIRLNPRKADLQAYRECFADRLCAYDVIANATPRHVRGTFKKDKQAVKHIDKSYEEGKRQFPSYVSQLKNKPQSQAIKDKVYKTRNEVIKDYHKIAKALANGNPEDRKLAVEVAYFAKNIVDISKVKERTKEVVKRSSSDKEH